MNRQIPAAIALLLAALPSVYAADAPASAGKPVPAPTRESAAIDRAVAAVYPALVRIHVVAEEGSDGRMRKLQGTGSGAIISKDGYILTNHHVARRATRLVCRLSNREEIDAVLVGTDPLADIAVLKLDLSTRRDPSAPLAVAEFGDSSTVKVGDAVLAMGSPAGLSQSVTKGIVANTAMIAPANMGGLVLDGENVGELVRWIGHDAVIFPGNSGGPLVNLDGTIIGVNEVGIGSLGGAIPGNLARKVAQELIEKGHVVRSWIGLDVQPLLRGMTKERGILVAGVLPRSPALEAGFKAGDYITFANGQPVADSRSPEDVPLFNQVVLSAPVGSKIVFAGLRDGKPTEWTVTTREREPIESADEETRGWGLTVRDHTLASLLETHRTNRSGVVVDSIRPGGPAAEAKPSLSPGDVITHVGGAVVSNAAALRARTLELTDGLKKKNRALVAFDRNDESLMTVVRIGPEPDEDRPEQPDKAWLGAETQVISTELAEALDIAGRKGVRVSGLLPQSPAEKAGLQTGDLLLKLDGTVIAANRPEDTDVFDSLIRAYRVGDEIELQGQRDGKPLTIKVKLGLRPKDDNELSEYKDDRFEFTARELSFGRRVESRMESEEKGVLIDQVQPGGWAALAGVTTGDILLAMDGKPVQDIKDLRERMNAARDAKPKRVVFFLKRGIRHRFVEVEPQW